MLYRPHESSFEENFRFFDWEYIFPLCNKLITTKRRRLSIINPIDTSVCFYPKREKPARKKAKKEYCFKHHAFCQKKKKTKQNLRPLWNQNLKKLVLRSFDLLVCFSSRWAKHFFRHHKVVKFFTG
uniref:Fumarate hydratase n=1 Tax=Rhizophora mucronata TaxID=61149 RepID=A0A2P2MCZ4_RHIMU